MAEVPQSGAMDHAHAIAKGLISSVPLAGGVAAELFSAIVQPPLERRKQKWMEAVSAALIQLQETAKVDVDVLSTNETFISTVLQASRAAAQTHEEEKLEALRNAVLHSALPCPPEDAIQQMFVSWVDAFNGWHIKILKMFRDPTAWFATAGKPSPVANSITSSLVDVLMAAYPELRTHGELADQVVRDLHARGLFGVNSLSGMMSARGAMEPRTTPMGNRFLDFITKPK